jgi:hypothetical protein
MTPAVAFPWARLVVAVAVLLAGIALGGGLAVLHFEPQLAEANRQLGEYQHAYLTLADASARQNAAIDELQRAGEARQQTARAAATRAAAAAAPHYAAAQNILGLKPPPGADPCRTASADFDAELAAERRPR